MDGTAASFWLDAITAGAAVAWLAGAWFVASSERRCTEPLRGEQRVAAAAPDVIASLTQQLALAGEVERLIGNAPFAARAAAPS